MEHEWVPGFNREWSPGTPWGAGNNWQVAWGPAACSNMKPLPGAWRRHLQSQPSLTGCSIMRHPVACHNTAPGSNLQENLLDMVGTTQGCRIPTQP